MTLNPTRLLVICSLGLAGTAHAQTTATPNSPSTGPSTAVTPTPATPPSGVARGVIRPNRPVDSGMVKHPPTNNQHKMPVIRPPGTAR